MLVLTRKLNERIMIGDDIVVTVLEVRSDNSVRIGIEAPRGIKIQREEVSLAVAEANLTAAHAPDTAAGELRALLGGTAQAE
ncbi:MAG TPA: carbon storage regulator CsrA [Glaciihabitans sp.]|jgi:carbon storage regulator|nr:carbon storage regulator CsrA [Glaciihabitans sp.]